MELKYQFNEVPAQYDRLRPTYVPELYADIAAYSGIRRDNRLLEIGIGTGQATRPFLDMGCHVTAIELGENLAAYTREKFRGYPKFDIIHTAFEDCDCPDSSIDLIYSASAFHWIPEEIGYTKVYRMLKSGGVFARFANHPYKDKGNEPLHIAIQEVYAKYMPGSRPSPEYSEQMAKSRARISENYGFIDTEYRLYHRIRTLDAQAYAELIGTYSDHRALGVEKMTSMQNTIQSVINRHGGKINIYDTIDLQLAKKP